ncbi:MAG TPA: hypothetical protein VMN39_13050 [Longimicrobiaceae bacterium]|nr:hypothetical protein [Longimicrobiaceae bacterium]
MIAVLLHDMRWRLLLVAFAALVFYLQEPGFHQHEGFDPMAVALGPLGISATLANLAGLSMIILLAGMVSTDRREGYTRLLFAQPTSPLAYYGLRWGLAYLISFTAAVALLLVGQVLAWGAFLGGWSGLVLPLLSGLVYGSLIFFFSVILPRGDAWVVFALLLPTFIPEILDLVLQSAAPGVRQLVTFLLPPQGALQNVWEGLVLESFGWGGAAFAAAYGAIFLAAAAVILKLREWP